MQFIYLQKKEESGMNFHEQLCTIGTEFKRICDQQREFYLRPGSNNTMDVDAYSILKDLYDEDKNIKMEDSYSTGFVEDRLKKLKKKTEGIDIKQDHKFLLARFISHIDYNLDLIQLMIRLEEIAKIGKYVEDRLLFLLNYCIIADRTSYFQGLFISKLNELNTEILGIDNADYGLFYRVGALNFKRHLYPEAINCLGRAIILMDEMAVSYYNTADVIAQAEFRKALFKIKILRAVSYEFQGDFQTTIKLLVGKNQFASLKKLPINDFLYSSGIDFIPDGKETLDVIINQEQESVIYKVQSDIVNEMYAQSDANSCFAFAKDTDKWFSDRSKTEKEKILFLENGKNFEYFSNEKKNNNERYAYFQNENVHEVLHILAHTLNEYGVAERNQAILKNKENYEVGQILAIARALMLYTAKNQQFMIDCQKCLSCLATLFAEIGDYESAKSQLLENVNSNYYKNKDSLVQAEIEFFYYIVSLMANPNSPDIKRDLFFAKYSKCCYNHFDYDALTQIEKYKFKYEVATAILGKSGQEKRDDVISKNLKKCLSDFDQLNTSMQPVFVSNWTKNEHDKINIMFQFLIKYYDVDKRENTLSKEDMAKKYLYLYAKSVKFTDTLEINQSVEERVPEIICFLTQVFHQSISELYKEKEPIIIRNCIYRDTSNLSKNDEDSYINNTVSKDIANIYFITTKNSYENIKRHRHVFANLNEEEVLRHFIIHCAFDSILDDFINPQNIFMLVPFVGAEPQKYQLESFDDLLLEIHKGDKNEKTTGIKNTQKERVASKFLKNYNFGNVSNWVEKIINIFTDVEVALWNDEDINTVYLRERFYMRNRDDKITRCYPLLNHPGFILTLEDIINSEEVDLVHDPCDNNECCQNIIEWNDQITIKLNSFFCLRTFCAEQLQNKRIIVKYSRTKKQWRIVVVKSSISKYELNILQAYICENSYIEKNIKQSPSVKPSAPPIDKGELEKNRRIVQNKYNELYEDYNKWFKGNITVIPDEIDIDIARKKCYEKGREDFWKLHMKFEDIIKHTDELNGIISQFENDVEAIKTRVEGEIKQINEKGVKSP